MTDTDSRRLFLALWPPEDAIRHLEAVTQPLRDSSPDRLRWQPSQRWHITVMFLGDVPHSRIGTIDRRTRPMCRDTRPATTALAGSGRHGSVLWVGVATGGWLDDLARGLERRLQPGTRHRPYRPHLTLARARNPPRDQRDDQTDILADPLAQLRRYEGPSWLPTSVALVRSELGPQPVYSVVERFPLGG